MDKLWLQQQVLQRLADDLQRVEQAARFAHETATHEENIAENKYDTLGLEASYLATGQARRAEALRQALLQWRQWVPPSSNRLWAYSWVRWFGWWTPTGWSSSFFWALREAR